MNLKVIKSQSELDKVEIRTFSEAIRAKCYDSCGYDTSEVRKCQSFSCPLWLFRNGKRFNGNRVEEVRRTKEEFHKSLNSPKIIE